MTFGVQRAGAAPQWPQSVSLPRRACLALGGVLAAVLLAALALEPEAAVRLLNRFLSIHAVLGAALLTSLAGLGLAAVGGTLATLAGLLEALQRAALAGLMMGALPAALPEETDLAVPEPAAARDPALAESEIQAGLYLGGSISPPSDVRLKAPDGTDMTLKKVKWKAESLVPAIYYGVRGIDWNERFPRLGGMVDFTHAKATAIRSQNVEQAGTREGKAVPPKEPITKTFRKLEFTHGLNFITLNGVVRFSGWRRRTIPYLGLGLGFMIPHAEIWRAGRPRDRRVIEARVTGLAYQVFAGVEWKIFVSDRYSALTEYKLTYTTNDVTTRDDDQVTANIWVHGLNVGVYRTMWRRSDMAAK
ncbi:MAG: hypothetical protein ACR2PO_11220 [Methyloligellaceae bacterium]